MERCSTLSFIRYLFREIIFILGSNKTKMIYHYTSTTMSKIQDGQKLKSYWGYKATGMLRYCLLSEGKMIEPFWKTGWHFIIRSPIHLGYNIAIPLLIHSQEIKTKDLHTNIHRSFVPNSQKLQSIQTSLTG